MRSHIIAAVFFLFLIASAPAREASAAIATVSPSSVFQGDAFAITVSGGGNSSPAAVFMEKELDFSSCGEGCFMAIGAVDMDAKPGVRKITVSTGKSRQTVTLAVKRAHFPSLSLTLPEEKVVLSPEDQARADKEAELLQNLWKIKTERQWKGSFVSPTKSEISTVFGAKRVINRKKTSIHRGIDLRGRAGDEVRAANSGKVVVAEDLFFGGNTIVLDHGHGIYTVYMHLSGFAVKANDHAAKGDVIGFVGSSGRASGPHLHFGVKIDGINANPVSLLGLRL